MLPHGAVEFELRCLLVRLPYLGQLSLPHCIRLNTVAAAGTRCDPALGLFTIIMPAAVAITERIAAHGAIDVTALHVAAINTHGVVAGILELVPVGFFIPN